ncbi:MAG TPA: hypothetical protein PL017_06220 [Tenuifilaceae bacterium]|nr:hypothetical protein [Tenuifilaceae bacterium]
MRDKISIFLISASLIGFQLAIINLLSYSQWHHFAFLAVSIAMLGFGSSGVLLAVKTEFFVRNSKQLILWLFLLCGISTSISPLLINTSLIHFDTFLIFSDSTHLLKFIANCLILFFPFLFGALAIGLYFTVYSSKIPLLYAWNLSGSALGGILLVVLSSWIFPLQLASIFGIFCIAAGFLVCNSRIDYAKATTFLSISILILFYLPQLPRTSQYKPIARTLLIPDSKITRIIPTRQGVIEVVKSQSLRPAQGVSLNYFGEIPTSDVVFLNGDHYFVLQKKSTDSSFYSSNIYALPYKFLSNTKVLLLQPNSTSLFENAEINGADEVTVVEPNSVAASLIQTSNENPEIKIERSYPREFIAKTGEKWNIIQFPTIGTFGGSSGISAISEEYLFTVNGLAAAMEKLTCEGIIILSTYIDSPPRFSLKIISLVSETLKGKNVKIEQTILAVRSWNLMLILVKPSGFKETDFKVADSFCSKNGFDLFIPNAKNPTNILTDSTLTFFTERILKSENKISEIDYPFNIEAPTDNKPFFSQFLKVSRFREYKNWLGTGIPFLELGYIIVWVSLIICSALAVLAILFPMIIWRRGYKSSFSVSLYFAFLGIGYMLIEISLIQKSILILGNPVFASALIISSMLCFSAIGSYVSQKINPTKYIAYALGIIALLVSVVSIFFMMWFDIFESLSRSSKIFGILLFIFPLTFFMGMAFPLGMKIISEKFHRQIPVAWGVNGFFSVLAAPLATIISVEWGFSTALFISALLYLFCIPVVMVMVKRM